MYLLIIYILDLDLLRLIHIHLFKVKNSCGLVGFNFLIIAKRRDILNLTLIYKLKICKTNLNTRGLLLNNRVDFCVCVKKSNSMLKLHNNRVLLLYSLSKRDRGGKIN